MRAAFLRVIQVFSHHDVHVLRRNVPRGEDGTWRPLKAWSQKLYSILLVIAYHRASPDSRGVEVDLHLLIGRVAKNL